MNAQNLCTQCGACCAYYRISFDSREVDDQPGGIIPVHLTVKLDLAHSAMKGTLKRPMRCAALMGNVAHAVFCAIYDRRPSACRNFLSLWEHDVINRLCDRARTAYGLTPLNYY